MPERVQHESARSGPAPQKGEKPQPSAPSEFLFKSSSLLRRRGESSSSLYAFPVLALHSATGYLTRWCILSGPRLDLKPTCEVCAKPLAEREFLLCPDCSHAFTIGLETLHDSGPTLESWLDKHPELTPGEVNRIREVFVAGQQART